MTADQIQSLINALLLFGLLLTGGSIVLAGGALIVLHNVIKGVRSDTALITAIDRKSVV